MMMSDGDGAHLLTLNDDVGVLGSGEWGKRSGLHNHCDDGVTCMHMPPHACAHTHKAAVDSSKKKGALCVNNMPPVSLRVDWKAAFATPTSPTEHIKSQRVIYSAVAFKISSTEPKSRLTI